MNITRSMMTVMAKELQNRVSTDTSDFYNYCIRHLHMLIYIHGYRFAYSSDKEEYIQEVVIRVWKNLHTFDDQKAEFCTWLETIARNEYYRYSNRTKKEAGLIQPLTEDQNVDTDFHQIDRCPSAEDRYISNLTVNEIYKLISQLHTNQMNALELCRLGNMTPVETAHILGCKSSNVSLWLNRAVGKIRQAMQEEEYDFEPAA